LCSQGSRQSNLVLFGSTREGSDPVRCRYVRGSLGRIVSPSRGVRFYPAFPACPADGGVHCPSPRKTGGGWYAGVMCGRWRLLWRSPKTPHRVGEGQSWPPKARSSHSPPSLGGPVLVPLKQGCGFGASRLGRGRGGVPKAKQIGTAGVVHISLLGVKSYDQGKMN